MKHVTKVPPYLNITKQVYALSWDRAEWQLFASFNSNIQQLLPTY